jgi:hypothetical protein
MPWALKMHHYKKWYQRERRSGNYKLRIGQEYGAEAKIPGRLP